MKKILLSIALLSTSYFCSGQSPIFSFSTVNFPIEHFGYSDDTISVLGVQAQKYYPKTFYETDFDFDIASVGEIGVKSGLCYTSYMTLIQTQDSVYIELKNLSNPKFSLKSPPTQINDLVCVGTTYEQIYNNRNIYCIIGPNVDTPYFKSFVSVFLPFYRQLDNTQYYLVLHQTNFGVIQPVQNSDLFTIKDLTQTTTTDIQDQTLNQKTQKIYYDLQGNQIIPTTSGVYILQENNTRSKIFLTF